MKTNSYFLSLNQDNTETVYFVQATNEIEAAKNLRIKLCTTKDCLGLKSYLSLAKKDINVSSCTSKELLRSNLSYLDSGLNKDIFSILKKELNLLENNILVPIRDLELYGTSFHFLAEEACNRGSSDYILREMGYLEEITRITVQKISPLLKLAVNTDPRGNPFGLILPSGRSNNLGGEDWRLEILREDND